MSNLALKYSPEDLIIAVIRDRLDAVGEQARVVVAHRGSQGCQLMEVRTLGSLASALSGFLGELDGMLSLAAGSEVQVQAGLVIQEALEASRNALHLARARGAPRATLRTVLLTAEALRGLREDLILAAVRAR